jgi:hypothetical protein
VLVIAYFDRDPLPEKVKNNSPMRGVVLGSDERLVGSDNVATFADTKISQGNWNDLANKDYYVTINVDSERKSSKDNLLDCDVPNGRISTFVGKSTQVSCKLIGEHMDRDDDYAIYSEVIGQQYAREGVERIVIVDHTFTIDQPRPATGNAEYGKEFYDAVANETHLDYDKENKSPMVLDQKGFSLKTSVTIMSETERDRIFSLGSGKEAGNGKPVKRPGGWEEFSRLYPKSQGVVSLSRIGFNSSKTQALVYVGNVCGGRCGEGNFFLLVKEAGKWKIQDELNVWIS